MGWKDLLPVAGGVGGYIVGGPAGAYAGYNLGSSMASSGQNQNQTSTQQLDPATEYYRQQMMASAANAAGVTPYGGTASVIGGGSDDQKTREMLQRISTDPKLPFSVRDTARKKLASLPAPGSGTPGAPGSQGSITGIDPQTQAAIDAYQQYAGLGQQGVAALGGDQAAIAKYMNPYQTNVLDTVRGQYGLLNSQAQMGINDAATRAGAFGGSRQGVASGVASGEIARGLGEQISGLQYQGYNDAMGRAGDQARLGLGALGALPALGQYAQGMNDPNLRRMMLLQRGMAGMPYGSQTSQSVNSNPWGEMLGTGLTIASLFGGGQQQQNNRLGG